MSRIGRFSAAVGAVLWIGFVALARPEARAAAWAEALLLLGPLVIVPLGLDLVWRRRAGEVGRPVLVLRRFVRVLHPPAAVLFLGAYLLEPGPAAAVLVVPWLLVAGLVALAGGLSALGRFRRERFPAIAAVCLDAGQVFLAVGAAWALADRFGVRPLDFSPAIVLLTAVHFHYAGFALPVVTGLAARRLDGTGGAGAVVGRAAAGGVIVGVPAVAVGITTSQLGLSPAIECLAAWFMAVAGGLTAWLHLRLTADGRATPAARLLWGVAALSLLFSMALAALYGARAYLEIPWLDIPWMRALHGTANALGFALAGLLGWASELDGD